MALGATLVLGSAEGEREVKAEDFFKGLFETDSASRRADRRGEISGGTRRDASTGFAELSRRHGDFALVGLAALATMQVTA